MKLYDIAHSRAGDKGNTLTLSLIPYDESNYEALCREATAERVKEHLKECDFCCAELRLLAHHEPIFTKYPVPEIPMNLRILAESILISVTNKAPR